MQGPVGPLSRGVGDEAKVPDGLRYHVLDVWVEELVPVLEETKEENEAGEVLMDAVRRLGREGLSKALRKRAKETVGEWEKRKDREETEGAEIDGSVRSEDEWKGFGD